MKAIKIALVAMTVTASATKALAQEIVVVGARSSGFNFFSGGYGSSGAAAYFDSNGGGFSFSPQSAVDPAVWVNPAYQTLFRKCLRDFKSKLPPDSQFVDQSENGKRFRTETIALLATLLANELYTGTTSPNNLDAKINQILDTQFFGQYPLMTDIVVVGSKTPPLNLDMGPIEVPFAPINLGSNHGGETGDVAMSSTDRERQCKDAMSSLKKYLQDEKAAGTKVFLIGEEHETVTHLYGDILNEIDSTPAGSCFMTEFVQGVSYSADYIQMEAEATAAGWRVIRFDQAAGYSDRDPAGSPYGGNFNMNNFSSYGMNTRDALMANAIRANASNCEKIVTQNGAAHLFHKYDDPADGPRVNLPERLGDMKHTEIDLVSVKDMCGRDPNTKSTSQPKAQQSGAGASNPAPTLTTSTPVTPAAAQVATQAQPAVTTQPALPAQTSVTTQAAVSNYGSSSSVATLPATHSMPVATLPTTISLPVQSSTCPRDATSVSVNSTMTCACAAPVQIVASIWGNGIYTSDSSICTAALHAGVISSGGGSVTIRALGAQASFGGGYSNGVQSNSYGAWGGSFSFGSQAQVPTQPQIVQPQIVQPQPQVTAPAVTVAQIAECPRDAAGLPVNVPLVCQCAGSNAQMGIWGSGIYTSDSPICIAAVHAGKTPRSGGVVTVRPLGPQASFAPSSANGIASWPYGNWPSSYRFD